MPRMTLVAPALEKNPHAPPPRTVSERPAIRFAAVPARRRLDAGLRHHGPGQSGAWLFLDAGGLFRRHLRGAHGKLRARRAAGAGRDPPGRNGGRADRGPQALWPRPPRSCARHLRADPVFPRAGAAHMGTGPPEPSPAPVSQPVDPDSSLLVLP